MTVDECLRTTRGRELRMWVPWWLEEMAREHGLPSQISSKSNTGALSREEMIEMSKARARSEKRG